MSAPSASPQARRVARAAEDVRRSLTGEPPEVGLVLGSGLGVYADGFEDRAAVPYEAIETMPRSAVEGHAGNLVFGRRGSCRLVAMQGRAHLYEGHAPADVVFGVRLMIRLGARTVIVTNAAGGIDPALSPGDLMLLRDHINWTGHNALVGPDEPGLGPRFVDMTTPYDDALRRSAHAAASDLGFPLREGVYAGLLGPSYETPAEIHMLRTLGAHAVGMSTVLEVIAARHMGARVLGLSCITNLAAGLGGGALSHDDVKATAESVRDRFEALLSRIVEGMG